MNIGFWEILLILVLALLLFGGKKLPELARSLGKAMREFRSGMNDLSDDEAKSAGENEETKRKSSAKKTAAQRKKG